MTCVADVPFERTNEHGHVPIPELLDEVQDQERYGTPRVLVKPMNLDALVGAIHDMIGDA